MADIKESKSEIVLYDIPGKDPATAWSLNAWKSRLALNFKGLKYRTQWVEYPDIAPLLESLNVKTNTKPKAPPYTIPAVRFPSGETIQDSLFVAARIEELYPTPSMHLDAPIIPDIQKAVYQAFLPLFSVVSPYNNEILNPSSHVYFGAKNAREEAEYGPDPVGEAAWEAATEPLRKLAMMIEGPFVAGPEVAYADFVVVGFLRHVWRVGGEEVFERVMGIDESGKLRAMYQGVEKLGLLDKSD